MKTRNFSCKFDIFHMFQFFCQRESKLQKLKIWAKLYNSVMNRFAWYDGKTDPNERTLGSQTNVRLYDGEEKVSWNFCTRQLPDFSRENQEFLPICLGKKIPEANFFIGYENLLFIFCQIKIFQNFVKLLTKIIAYLYRCSQSASNHFLLFMEQFQVFPFIFFSEKPLYFSFFQSASI